MAALTPLSPALTGTTATPATPAGGGDTVVNPKGNVLLDVNNASGSSINVTIAVGPNPTRPADGTFPAQTVVNQVVAVGAGARKIIGPIPPVFNDANGLVNITTSAQSQVTILPIQP